MIPTLVPEPVHRDGWIYEEKADGWRIPWFSPSSSPRSSSCSSTSRVQRHDAYLAIFGHL
jgi:hypothetical protein